MLRLFRSTNKSITLNSIVRANEVNKNMALKVKNKFNRFIFDKEGYAPIFEHVNGAVSIKAFKLIQ